MKKLLLCVFLLATSCVTSKEIHVRLSTKTKEILRFVEPYLPSNPIIVEAGAYNGDDTVQLARFWPQGHVYTFEPVPELFKSSMKKTSSYSNVTLYPFALGDFEGRSIFFLSEWPSRPGKISGSSSLLSPKDHLIYDTYTRFPAVIEVDTTTFDNWALSEEITKVDFLWLDMQGYELNMLKASEVAKTAKAIWIEVEFAELYNGQYLYADVREWMKANDFRLIAVDFDESTLSRDIKSLRRGSGNALFVKTK